MSTTQTVLESSYNQMKRYFSDSDDITCPITFAMTVEPVNLVYSHDMSTSIQVFDLTAICRIAETNGTCPVSRQEFYDYKELSLPPFIAEFNKVTTKSLDTKSDITAEDQKIVAEFIDNYLELGLDLENLLVTGCNLLYIAAKFGLPMQVKKLLDRNMNPDLPQSFGVGIDDNFLPLGISATLGHYEVAEALLSHTTNPANPNKLINSKEYKNVACAYFAARYDQAETLQLLIAHNAKFNSSTTCNGITALYQAVYRNYLTTVKEILKAKDLEIDALQTRAGEHQGQSALFLAILHGNHKMASLLLSAGANPQQQQGNGHNKGKTIFDIKIDDSNLELKNLLSEIRPTMVLPRPQVVSFRSSAPVASSASDLSLPAITHSRCTAR